MIGRAWPKGAVSVVCASALVTACDGGPVCGSDAECAAQHRCVDAMCLRLCSVADDCFDGQTCDDADGLCRWPVWEVAGGADGADDGFSDADPLAFDLFGDLYCPAALQLTGASFVGGSIAGTPKPDAGGMALDFFAVGPPARHKLLIGQNMAVGRFGSQLFEIVGTDDRGAFSSSSQIKYLYGPEADHEAGGRPSAVLYADDEDRGTGVDRNIYVTTFTDADTLRAYDADSFEVGFIQDALASQSIEAFMHGSGALERAPRSDKLLVGGRGPSGPLLRSFDLASHTFDIEEVDLVTAGMATGVSIGDLARADEEIYLATDHRAGELSLFRLTVSVDVRVGLLGHHDFRDVPFAGLSDATTHLYGVAVGRAGTIYLTGHDGELVTLYTLSPREGSMCP